jgi:hypothetical protein
VKYGICVCSVVPCLFQGGIRILCRLLTIKETRQPLPLHQLAPLARTPIAHDDGSLIHNHQGDLNITFSLVSGDADDL